MNSTNTKEAAALATTSTLDLNGHHSDDNDVQGCTCIPYKDLTEYEKFLKQAHYMITTPDEVEDPTLRDQIIQTNAHVMVDLQASSDDRDQLLFSEMVDVLLEIPNFFDCITAEQLKSLGDLFGMVIKRKLMAGENLEMPHELVLDALKHEVEKVFVFGIRALNQYVDQVVEDWPQHVESILGLPDDIIHNKCPQIVTNIKSQQAYVREFPSLLDSLRLVPAAATLPALDAAD